MINKKINFAVAVFVTVLLLFGLFSFLNFSREPVSAILNSNYASIGDIFFIIFTMINQSTYETLINRLGSRVGQINTIDQGTPIVFTMAGRDWQVVYRDPNDSDTITIWMTEPYTTSAFNPDYFYPDSMEYISSDLRELVQEYYNTQSTQYTALSKIVVSPNEVSSQYKTAQDAQHTIGNTESCSGNISTYEDKFWVPSFYETFAFWGLDNTDRIASSVYWLRSGSAIYGDLAQYSISVNTSGSASSEGVDSRRGVRPACHISLNALSQNLKVSVNVATSDVNQGTVSGGGEYDVDYSGNTTITATAINGYIFDYWQDSSGNRFYQNPYTFPVTQSETYTAYFRLPQITITSSTSGSEIASTSTEKLDLSTRYTLTFNSNRYIFAIQLNGGAEQKLESINGALGVDSSCLGITYLTNTTGSQLHLEIFNISADVTIALIFVDISQSYTPSSGGVNLEGVALQVSGGSGSNLEAVGEARITGYTTTENLTTIHVSAVASSGYYFVRWETNDDTDLSQYGSSADIPYDLVEGKILTAVFAPTPTNSQTNSTTNNVDDEIG